ncbi:MAG TPA: hypothetical protein VIB39_19580 [Candidatus Angelobacter sp.]
MGHFLLPCSPQITLIVIRQAAKEGRRMNDVGVRGNGQRFGNLRGNQDLAITLAQSVFNMVVVTALLFSQQRERQHGRDAGYGCGRQERPAAEARLSTD